MTDTRPTSLPLACALLASACTGGAHHTRPDTRDMFADSAAYEKFMGRWSRLLAPTLVRLGEVADGDAVLDIGSGTGVLTFAVVAAAPTAQVTGIDPSPQFVEYARAHAPSARVSFQVGDAQALPMADASFSRTLALLVMNFIPDPAKALREMTRVTRPGGTVAAVVWDYGDGMQMLRIFWDEVVALDPSMVGKDERNMPLRRQGELGALWRAQGLERVEEQPIVIEQSFASFDDYWQPFLGGPGPAGAYASKLAPAARSALEARLRQRLLGDGPDHPFTLTARAWAVKGVVGVR